MNNKGFTLIEIIAVIGLLALIATMIGSNLVSMDQRQKQKNYDNYKQTIADAACLYFESKGATMYDTRAAAIAGGSGHVRSYCLTHICYVSTRTLLNKGYLDKELKDPTTMEEVTEREVAVIRYVGGKKVCCYEACS